MICVPQSSTDVDQIITTIISPQIYRLLSDMLPPVVDETISAQTKADRQVFISRLTKCWSDCAGVVVIEQNSPVGRARLRDMGLNKDADDGTGRMDTLRRPVWQGVVAAPAQRARTDASRLAFHAECRQARSRRIHGESHPVRQTAKTHSDTQPHADDFIALLSQTIVTDMLTIEHKYLSAVLAMPAAFDHPLLVRVSMLDAVQSELDRAGFMEVRSVVLEGGSFCTGNTSRH